MVHLLFSFGYIIARYFSKGKSFLKMSGYFELSGGERDEKNDMGRDM